MPDPRVTVVIPTLAADSAWLECVRSLERQTQRDFEMVVVDNSGERKVRRSGSAPETLAVIEPERNLGFGAALNLAWARSRAAYLATLNDDALAHPGWLEALVAAMESDAQVGMCASAVRLWGGDRMDSAGMLLGTDGSSRQRGHGEPQTSFSEPAEVFFPSASAALYRRRMLDEIGGFDDSFFLYCEDTDLGLRARWAGWRCLYAPGALVEHRYSHSAGRASPLKAYYVERNRLFVAVKNLPLRLLVRAPFYTLARYLWHAALMLGGRGKAAEFRLEYSAWRLPGYVIGAHWRLAGAWPRLWRERKRIQKSARITAAEFCALARRFWLSPRQVAAL